MTISKPSSTSQSRTAFWSSLVLAIIHTLFTATLVIIGIQVDVRQMLLTAVITGTIAIVGFIAAILCRQGYTVVGIWMVVCAVALGIPLIPIITAGLGWISLFSIPIVIILMVTQTLPPGHNTWAILIGVLSGVATLLIDVFGRADRVEIPNTNIIIPIGVAILALVAVFLISRQFANYTLRTKLLIFFLIVALVPLIGLAYFNSSRTTEILTQSAIQNLSAGATLTANQIDAFINSSLRSVRLEANLPTIKAVLEVSQERVLPVQQANGAAITTIIGLIGDKQGLAPSYYIIDTSGEVILNYPFEADKPPIFVGLPSTIINEINESSLSDIPYVSPVIFFRDQPSLIFAHNIYGGLGEPAIIGTLIEVYEANELQSLIEEANGLVGTDSYGVLFDENQIYLAHGTDPETLYKTVAEIPAQKLNEMIENLRLPDLPGSQLTTNLPELEAKLANAQTESLFTTVDIATGERINQVAVYHLESQPWMVAFLQPQDVFLSQVQQQNQATILILLVIAGVVALLSIGASRLLAAPIANLSELVERITGGDLSIQVPVVARDEIGRLASAFNALTTQTRELLSGLELQIIRRTQELERQTIQLQTAAEVARDASAFQDLEEILFRTVHLISERFGFYHAGIFLLDDREEYAILRAASSEGGKQMLQQGHKLRVGQVGIVGDTTATGQPHIALNVEEDVAHFAHPFLPETRSEMALPLKIGQRIIGALDVQSEQQQAFDESDIEILQIMADQLATAIENARLFAEVQSSVLELQSAYGQYTIDAWLEWMRGGEKIKGYRYRKAGVEPISEQTSDQQIEPEEQTTNFISVPLRLRGESFGTINIQVEGDQIPTGLTELVTIVAERLAVNLDGARLYQDAQRRAAQEQLTREITSRIRETLDIDSVLKTATQEIGERLGLHDLTIQLDMSDGKPPERSQ
jgi:GAF domain-containing protein/HAMP domain-containing protein